MNSFYRGICYFCLFLGFLLLFRRIRWLEWMGDFLRRTQAGMEGAARQRSLADRQNLLAIYRGFSLLSKLEHELHYSGLRIRFPFFTVEMWIVVNVLLGVFLFSMSMLFSKNVIVSGCAVLSAAMIEYVVLRICKAHTMRTVNDNLLKFLDFLGNYSITAGEVTGIFNQISKYMEEPLQSVLEECFYEAQTTGDAGMALLSMAEKVEHIKFKELVRNMEISIRYCADFTALVSSSRKSMREYLRIVEERKGMLREAMINMVLLLGMSVMVLITVDKLIAVSIWEILFDTMVGRAGLGVIILVFLLFARKVSRIHE